MSAANELHDQTGRRLGRLPVKSSRKALQFSDFFKFVKLPTATKYWTTRKPFPLQTFGNDQVGDCTRAKQAAAAYRMERVEQKRSITITDAEVMRVYREMSDRLYGGGDNGAYEDDALNEWRHPETTFRDTAGHPYTIDAYLRINPFNHDEVRAGLALSGARGIAVCLNLPAAFQSIEPPADWALPLGQPLIGAWMPGSWGGHCAAGDTEIPLLSGETARIQDLVGQRDLWVYGCLPTSQPVPACAEEVVRTKHATTVRVFIDDDTSVRTTPDHPFMLRDGSYCRADQLVAGSRLMPLRRQVHHRGYEKVKWYDSGKKQAFTHRLVALSQGCQPEQVTHHRDSNKRNNHPANLAFGSQADHMRIHRPWEQSSLTDAPGWFATAAGRAYARSNAASRQRFQSGQYVPASENHKVVRVECEPATWVYDLLNVSPTNNYAAGSVFIHNSMWARDYDAIGIWLVHTWGLPDQRITWEAAAVYLDECHLVVDSIDAWRKKPSTAVKFNIKAVVAAVNDVSSFPIQP